MKKIILIVIIVLAFVLRFWQIGQVPISLDWDEAALGYNAYSILLTGKDEYGKFLPVVLESFGDFKPALYAYLIIPFIPIFGLNELSVRIPAALVGVFAVLLTYFLAKEFLKRSDAALVATFLMAVSPWHIQLSRVAFEAGVGMAFNLAGILFFHKGLKKPILFGVSALFFSLSLYTYQSEKLFVPIMLLLLGGIYWRNLLAIPKKFIFLAIALLLVFSFPITHYTFSNQNGLARARGVSIFSDTAGLLQRDVKLLQYHEENNYYLGKIFDNRRVVYAKSIVEGYLSHFDLNWWFITGDSTNRHHAPQMALFYLAELPFVLAGFYFLVFTPFKISKKTKLFLIMWVLVAPITASFTTGVPHAIRTLNFLPSFQIITAIGFISIWGFVSIYKKFLFRYKVVKAGVITFFVLIYLFNFIFYLNQYFVQQNYFYAKDWIYGYKQLVEYLNTIHTKYKKVAVSNKGYMDNSYMFFLFYQKYDPRKYLAEGGTRISGIERNGNKFLNYEFRSFNYDDEKNLPVLLVGTDLDFKQLYKVVNSINSPDGKSLIRVVEKE